MPLFEMTSTTFRPVPEASFAAMGIGERSDIQRLLRTQIDVLGDDLYVLTEEFGDWEDSRRRIDLLAVDAEANLVVVELKRTAYGGQGLWSRWTAYAKTGHGGNAELKALLAEKGGGHAEKFQVSILEVCDLNASDEFILGREGHWKAVLRTREFGLNGN